LREKYGTSNSPKIIELAYDLQAGVYCDAYMHKKSIQEYYINIAKELSEIIHNLCPNVTSILEAGIGEGNCIGELLNHFNDDIESAGFDISWSRVAYARAWLGKKKHVNSKLFTGDLLNIPCAENSFDIVYTLHAVEPNKGNEEEIIRELYRVARKYLILMEPSYELANDEAKKRMEALGYIRGLESIAEKNRYNIIEYKLSPYASNSLNPTAIMIIEKGGSSIHDFKIACPQFKSKLEDIDGALYSIEGMKVYPIINGIPCLRIENSIIASKYELFAKK
jgi:ubiquinone/menaquinone biosynthesis C-methylase UbiE/uncharacterized protein YbaR (Trm112 family)